MSHPPEIEHLVHGEFIAQPQLRPLEVVGRAVLTAAALEDAHYGHGTDRLLQLYRHTNDSTRAEYKKVLNLPATRFERVTIELSKRTLIIALEQGVPDTGSGVNLFVDKAVMAQAGSSRAGYVNNRELSQEQFNGRSLAQYRALLEDQLDDFELRLPPLSFFTKK